MDPPPSPSNPPPPPPPPKVSADVWTAFVDNLSRRVTRGALRELFNHYGKVIRVFIPAVNKKPRYQFSTFAFVQFASPGDLNRAIRFANKRKIDGRVIVVSKARFTSKQMESNPDFLQANKNGDKYKGESIRESPKVAAVRYDSLVDNRSFKEVLIGKPKVHANDFEGNLLRIDEDRRGDVSSNSFNFYFPISYSAWIDNALVGIARQIFDLDFVQKAFTSDGIYAKVAKWGNIPNSCIIIFDSCAEKDVVWHEKKEALSFWFDYIAPIMNSNGMPASFFSISLTGVPLQCWHESFFKALGNNWGEFIDIDESTKNKENLSVANLIIRAESPFDVPIVTLRKKVHLKSMVAIIGMWIRKKVASSPGKISPSIQGAHRFDRDPTFGLNQGDFSSPLNSREGGFVVGNGFDNNYGDNGSQSPRYMAQQQVSHISNSPPQRPVEQCAHLGVGPAVFADGFHERGTWPKLAEVPPLVLIQKNLNTSDGLDMSIGLYPIHQHNSFSVEFVPDSFDGLENHLEDQIQNNDKTEFLENQQGHEPKFVDHGNINSQKIGGNSFFNSSFRRDFRRLVRESLEIPGFVKSISSSPPSLEKIKSMEEALAVWEVSKVLKISFKGGKKRVLKKVCEIEEDASIGRGEKVRAVRRLIIKQKPNFLFLQETKLSSFKASIFRKLWNKPEIVHCFSPSTGSAGGLLCMWDGDWFTAEVQIIKKRFIATIGKLKSSGWQCGFLNVYGPSLDSEKREFFGDLLNVLRMFNVSWFVGGDFNSILNVEEKSGNLVNMTVMDIFRHFVQEAELVDLSLLICLCKGAHLLGVAIEIHLLYGGCNWGPRPFKFFSYSLEEEGFVDMVVSNLQNLQNKRKRVGILGLLRESKNAIKQWSGNHNFNFNKSILSLEVKIRDIECKIQHGFLTSSDLELLGTLRLALWKELRREEQIWLQKSRVKWFEEGDRNTKFFHLIASHRRRVNSLTCIRLNGVLVSDPATVKRGVFDFFFKAYNTKTAIEVENMNLNFNILSEAHRVILESSFTEEEVWRAIRSSCSNKAPGPDGFNMLFFKRFWPFLKGSIMKFFSDFFLGNRWENGINHSFITLIPKKSNPDSLEDFRPISLVGGIYKILSKVLASRLRLCANSIISKNQFAFIPGRQIMDCSFIANECIDEIRRRGAKGIVFKIDFKRAYDTVDWNFLIRVMKEMNFGDKWCNWIFKCISTASISILVNGVPTDSFEIARGLRQGCSLSPMLFNIVGESLNQMLSKAVRNGLFSGFVVGRGSNSVEITHLQFADDLMIFCDASLEQVHNIKRVLRVFELASGLQLNLKKCRTFGINIPDSVTSDWAAVVGCDVGHFPAEYLGLPLGPKRNSIALWDPVVAKFSTRLASWKANSLSFGGRLVLLKSVLSSLPIYYLSILQLPSSVYKKLQSLMSNFLWGSSSEKRKIHWMKWTDICCPKFLGGLGVIDPKFQNRALLGKWVWKFANEKDNLWQQIIRCKYNYSVNSLLPIDPGQRRMSMLWNGVIKSFFKDDAGGNVMRNNFMLQVGDGQSISFWSDIWLGDTPLKIKFPRIFALSRNKMGMIAEFGKKEEPGWNWNFQLRRQLYDWEISQWEDLMALLRSFRASNLNSDWVCWAGSSDGKYSVSSFGKFFSKQREGDFEWSRLVWRGIAPPKVEFFYWLVVQNRIPVKVELVKRGVSSITELSCPLCGNKFEIAAHLLFNCDISWLIWMQFAAFWGLSLVLPENPISFLYAWEGARHDVSSDSIWHLIPFVIIWSIWLMRNEIVFEKKKVDVSQILYVAKSRLAFWFKAKHPESVLSREDIFTDPLLADKSKNMGKSRSRLVSWSPPPSGTLKLNVDGAVTRDGGLGGVGGLLRNSEGKCLLSFSRHVGQVPPLLAEILAIKFGLEIFFTSVWRYEVSLIVESDSLKAVEWVSNPSSCIGLYSDLVKEIADLAGTSSISFRYISRTCNIDADGLAKRRKETGVRDTWISIMIKKTSSRNQRSKGIRTKHVLQICLLLGVCFWLIYQVKHSHDKRKEFDEKDTKVSVKEQTDDLIVKFGRKDLPHVQEVSKNYKHEEEEEEESVVEDETKLDEEQEEKPKRLEEEEHEGASKQEEEEQDETGKHEEEQQEEGSKHEEEEQDETSKHEEEEEPEEVQGEEGGKRDDEEQEVEVRDEEAEDEGKGDGDDEVDENEQERADAEVGNEEELTEEEKEREAEGDKESEEKGNDEKEGQEESEHSANDQSLDGGDREAHEAREEHYKADDASSAVSHDTQSISSEADKLETENSSENLTRNVLEQESKANAMEKTDGDENKSESNVDEGKHSEGGSSSNNDENKSELKVDEGKHSESDNSLNVTDAKENDHETGSANTEHISLPNTTNTTDFVDLASNNSTGESKETGNTNAKANIEMRGSLQNGTSAEDTTEDGMVTEEKYTERDNEATSNSQLSGSNAVDESKNEMVDSTTTESSNSLTNAESGISDDTSKINETAEGHSSDSSTTKDTTDSTQNEEQGGDDESRGTDENSDTSSNETVDGGHNDPNDSSDNTLSQEEKDAAVDLSTLPDITTEGSNDEDTVAE
ncbi:hypothetical protein GQ457_03G000290 [Hibiscus cannabinus]